MRISETIHASEACHGRYKREQLISDMKGLIGFVEAFRNPGGQVRVKLDVGDKWYETVLLLNMNIFGLKEKYLDYAISKRVFQDKLPNTFYNNSSGQWTALDTKTTDISFVVL